MKSLWLYLRCNGKFCELVPDDLEADEAVIEDHVSQVLRYLPFLAFVSRVRVHYFLPQGFYAIQVQIWYNEQAQALLYDDNLELDTYATDVRIEDLASRALFQFCWEVACVDMPDF